MKIVVSGASGLVGSALVPHLRDQGHVVLRLVRRPTQAEDEVYWDPAAGVIDRGALAGVEGSVHLSGAGVGDHRWTDDYKRTILRSRVDSTELLSRTLAGLDPLPRVMVSASAVDYYRDTQEEVTEASPTGAGFLAGIARAWEAAAEPAREAGIPVTHVRSGLILAPHGGLLQRLKPLIRLGLGGPLGSGRQWWSWITLHDHLRALSRLLDADLPGPVNLTTPVPVQQREFMQQLGRAAHRPAVLPVPSLAVRLAVGQLAELPLASHRVLPRRLLDAGFSFDHPDLTVAAPLLLP
jgi:uncharacterized protein (TIGR01777 family)